MFAFYISTSLVFKEFSQRLGLLPSLTTGRGENPLPADRVFSNLRELHAVAALLFSLLPTVNVKLSSTAFDFYFHIRNVGFHFCNADHEILNASVLVYLTECYFQAVFNYSQTLSVSLKHQQEITLKLYRDLLVQSHGVDREPVLDIESRMMIWERVSKLVPPQET